MQTAHADQSNQITTDLGCAPKVYWIPKDRAAVLLAHPSLHVQSLCNKPLPFAEESLVIHARHLAKENGFPIEDFLSVDGSNSGPESRATLFSAIHQGMALVNTALNSPEDVELARYVALAMLRTWAIVSLTTVDWETPTPMGFGLGKTYVQGLMLATLAPYIGVKDIPVDGPPENMKLLSELILLSSLVENTAHAMIFDSGLHKELMLERERAMYGDKPGAPVHHLAHALGELSPEELAAQSIKPSNLLLPTHQTRSKKLVTSEDPLSRLESNPGLLRFFKSIPFNNDGTLQKDQTKRAAPAADLIQASSLPITLKRRYLNNLVQMGLMISQQKAGHSLTELGIKTLQSVRKGSQQI